MPVRSRRALVGPLLLALSLCACAARYKLIDGDLAEAKAQKSLPNLRVYPSNRTISLYSEPKAGSVTVSREIRERSVRGRRRRILNLNTSGAIVGEADLNGAPLLWVTFDRSCQDPSCAYGWVRTEDGRYRLVVVPEREGYAPPRVYRACVMKRQQLKIGNLSALSEANKVLRLKRRKGRTKTIFLEVKRSIRNRVREQREREGGV